MRPLDWSLKESPPPPTGKEETRHIEYNHLNFRARIKRLERRTICFSRSEVLHDVVIKLYIHYSNTSWHQF